MPAAMLRLSLSRYNTTRVPLNQTWAVPSSSTKYSLVSVAAKSSIGGGGGNGSTSTGPYTRYAQLTIHVLEPPGPVGPVMSLTASCDIAAVPSGIGVNQCPLAAGGPVCSMANCPNSVVPSFAQKYIVYVTVAPVPDRSPAPANATS